MTKNEEISEVEVTLTVRVEGDVCEAHLHVPAEWFRSSAEAKPMFLASIHTVALSVDPDAWDDFQALVNRAMDRIVTAFLKDNGAKVVDKTETTLTPGEVH